MGRKRGDAQRAMQTQVTNIQIKALKPYVNEQVQTAAQQMQRKLAQQQLTYVADSNARLYLLEDIVCEKLGYTRDVLSEMILVREDEILKLAKVDRPAQKGDYLRVEFFAKNLETPEGGTPQEYQKEGQLFIVKDLMEEGSQHIHNMVVLSEALIGMKQGEEKEEIIEKKVSVKLKVSRISERTEPKNEVEPNA